MSLGGYIPDEETRQALAYAASRNVITVSAAGNSRDDNPEIAKLPLYPARYATDFGISVGAVDDDRFITDFSNLPGTDSRMNHIMAPGDYIYSTVPGNQYNYNSGTSMAAPHVAGVVALMLSANPNLTHAQIRQILTETSTRFG